MIGDKDDMRERLRLTLPDRWFADAPPIMDGVLAGLGSLWAGLHTLLGVVRLQSRLATTTGRFLDLASKDFFAGRVTRHTGETDGPFRLRLQRAMRRERGTRAALEAAAAEAGFTVRIFEPARLLDTGAYCVASGLAWGVAGGWGSVSMPLECLVTAERGRGAEDDALRAGLADALPAGGAAWLRITG